MKIQNDTCFRFWFQPVGFVTFHTRAGAEAAKQDLQVIPRFTTHRHRERKRCSIRNARELPRAPLPSIFFLSVRLYTIYIYNIYISTHKVQRNCPQFSFPSPFFYHFFSLSLSLSLSPLSFSLSWDKYENTHPCLRFQLARVNAITSLVALYLYQLPYTHTHIHIYTVLFN